MKKIIVSTAAAIFLAGTFLFYWEYAEKKEAEERARAVSSMRESYVYRNQNSGSDAKVKQGTDLSGIVERSPEVVHSWKRKFDFFTKWFFIPLVGVSALTFIFYRFALWRKRKME